MSNTYPVSVTFELDDATLHKVARELAMDFLRRNVGLPLIVPVAVCTALFGWSLAQDAHPAWLALTALPLALFCVLLVGWALNYLLAPHLYRKRVSHLPHRRCSIDFAADHIDIRSATEDLRVAWSELAALDSLPNFWMLKLRSGAGVPIPKRYLSDTSASLFGSRAGDRAAAAPKAARDDSHG